MLGNMQKQGLVIPDLLEHAARYHGSSEIVSRLVEGGIHRYTYADALIRSKQLANALKRLGISPGERIGTLAWNTFRHFEVYYAVSGSGAVTHTINPRLFPEQISYIVNHANDRFIFVDLTFLPIVEALHGQFTALEGIIVLTDQDHMPETILPNVMCYESLIACESEVFDWPALDDELGATLCYTSGTTGNPKGVLYSHRSTILHAFGSAQREGLDINSESVVLPVVPMFHVCAWGIPYAAPMTGATIVFPGAGMDGASLTALIQSEKVDLLLGVPTVWLGLLNHLEQENEVLKSVERVVVGGSAAPISMIQAFDEKHNAFVVHAWGMTEMSPLGTVCAPTRAFKELPSEERYALQAKQGRPVFGVQLKIVDDAGVECKWNGLDFGQLLVKGPWIAAQYYLEEKIALDEDGWFDTGDVATIDSKGFMQIVDRKKDVIKSGGEWISSIELENAAIGHPSIQEACVIGVLHPKWDERPLLLIVLADGKSCDEDAILQFMTGKVAKWSLPDAVFAVDSLPHTATGKLLKKDLRDEYKNFLIEKAG
ncbi:MAG: acyl-CoA synthetase (AMP-forming)/AMP-acid ligase II [Oleiphilaceae bacterium]|jgi:acyl-CoA synthetase (AMP-forming)/AMP-acid ligase II